MNKKHSSHYKPKNRAEAERKLIVAAEEVFSESGYDGATTRAIAERADINLGLIKRYFGNKEGLLISTLEELFSKWQLDVLQYPPQKSLSKENQKYVEYSLKSMIKNESLFKIVLIKTLTDPSFLKSYSFQNLQFSDELIERFSKHLKKHPKKDREFIEEHISLLEHLVDGIFTTEYLSRGLQDEECLIIVQKIVSRIR